MGFQRDESLGGAFQGAVPFGYLICCSAAWGTCALWLFNLLLRSLGGCAPLAMLIYKEKVAWGCAQRLLVPLAGFSAAWAAVPLGLNSFAKASLCKGKTLRKCAALERLAFGANQLNVEKSRLESSRDYLFASATRLQDFISGASPNSTEKSDWKALGIIFLQAQRACKIHLWSVPAQLRNLTANALAHLAYLSATRFARFNPTKATPVPLRNSTGKLF